jgi:hypothetical protein
MAATAPTQHVLRMLPAIVLASGIAACHRAPDPDPARIACIERLEMPQYPRIALAAAVQGDVTVSVVVGAPGTTPGVSVQDNALNAPRFIGAFTTSLNDSVRASRFKPECSGQTVTLVYGFRLADREDPSVVFLGERVRFTPPNRFEIRAVRPPAMP